MFRKINKFRKDFNRLRKENSLSRTVFYYYSKKLSQRKTLKMKISSENIHLRTSSPDLSVALSSLGDEFSSLKYAYPASKKGLILDAGGYIGTSAICLAKMYPEATVVTIEPSSENFELLKMNIVGKDNIYAENAALAPRETDKHITLRNRGTGHWGFTIVENPNGKKISEAEIVTTVTINDILSKYGFTEILILKMDIEGGEYELFKDPQWLQKTNILVVELHERIVSGCEKAFHQCNHDRFVYKTNGEKYFSIGKNYFSEL